MQLGNSWGVLQGGKVQRRMVCKDRFVTDMEKYGLGNSMSTIRWPLTEPCYVIECQLDHLHGGYVRIHLHTWRAIVVLKRLFLKTEVVVVQADR